MPTPGSHGYDVQRARLRDQIDEEGTPDGGASAAANEQLQAEGAGQHVASGDDRARGPKGER